MTMGYFKTCWNDIKNTPNWFGKLLLLALLLWIPIFGPIVVLGYLYGWSRDIAWGVHAPMPAHIFGNEDGKLYSRGFFALIIAFVFALVPWFLNMLQSMVFGAGAASIFGSIGTNYLGGALAFTGIVSTFLGLAILVITFLLTFFEWIGVMRMSIYGRLSAGFQLTQIWKMFRKDFGGLLRIFGMALLLGFIFTVIAVLIIGLLVTIFIVTLGATAAGSGLFDGNFEAIDSSIIGVIFATGGLAFFVFLIFGYVAVVAGVFVQTMVARALGYWVRQFDVPNWRGQEDPLPFELEAPAPTQAPPAHPSE